jgi:hypothetical protein
MMQLFSATVESSDKTQAQNISLEIYKKAGDLSIVLQGWG